MSWSNWCLDDNIELERRESDNEEDGEVAESDEQRRSVIRNF